MTKARSVMIATELTKYQVHKRDKFYDKMQVINQPDSATVAARDDRQYLYKKLLTSPAMIQHSLFVYLNENHNKSGRS